MSYNSTTREPLESPLWACSTPSSSAGRSRALIPQETGDRRQGAGATTWRPTAARRRSGRRIEAEAALKAVARHADASRAAQVFAINLFQILALDARAPEALTPRP